MFDYQVSKHPHFDEACRAFALRHNLVQLAERCRHECANSAEQAESSSTSFINRTRNLAAYRSD